MLLGGRQPAWASPRSAHPTNATNASQREGRRRIRRRPPSFAQPHLQLDPLLPHFDLAGTEVALSRVMTRYQKGELQLILDLLKAANTQKDP